ncbi:hypothetical protein LAZ44_09715 [Vibrio alginolyticus]|nr:MULTISPECIES: hypothetical protein [Vibrio]MCA2450170.1 hypothetical protein [Vibrio alginolyticus]MCA2473700.1 hypothetical protein [Vibrio alginolyticus]MDW2153727.1 hypothetical protein [Vibrio sp. 2092]MDW2230175.1 hypothetical protein [Vibrio sp. 2091]
MRANIPYCFIDNDLSSVAREFIWSLRYSTHCIYSASNLHFDTDKYMFWTTETREYTELSITVKDNKVFFGDSLSNYQESRYRITCEKLEELVPNFESISLYILSDFSGEKKIVGMVGKDHGECRCLDHNSAQYAYLIKQLEDSIRTIPCNQLVRVEVKKDSFEFDVSQELEANELRILRACGINLALVIIQNLYERKVSTFKFVDAKYLDEYKDFDRIYFDLDETLIWEEEAITETISLLERLNEKNAELYLITRHKKVVKDTLKKINVNFNLFKEIIVVQDGDKKSSFVEGSGIFIDNEFPERLDVMKNTNLIALDIDQIEFLNV